MKKKLLQMGIDPVTHRPRVDLFSAMPQLIALAGLNDLLGAQLSQLVKIQSFPYLNLHSSTAIGINSYLHNPMDPWSNSISSLSKVPLPSNFPFSVVGKTELLNKNNNYGNLGSDLVSAPLVPHSLMDTSASNGDACSTSSYEKSAVSSIWPDNFSEENFLSDYASLQ
jgi:hypothetical protein